MGIRIVMFWFTTAAVTIVLYAIADAPRCEDSPPVLIGSALKIRGC